MITHCLTVDNALKLSLFVHNRVVTQSSCPALASVPAELNPDSFVSLLSLVDHWCQILSWAKTQLLILYAVDKDLRVETSCSWFIINSCVFAQERIWHQWINATMSLYSITSGSPWCVPRPTGWYLQYVTMATTRECSNPMMAVLLLH